MDEHEEHEDLEEGGDPVCWLHLVCEECGAIVSEGHRPTCSAVEEQSSALPSDT
jgi:hypothetical protein